MKWFILGKNINSNTWIYLATRFSEAGANRCALAYSTRWDDIKIEEIK